MAYPITQIVALMMAFIISLEAFRAVRSRRDRARWRSLRGARHWGWALLVMLGVLVLAIALYQIPALQWGWWSALGGHGSVVLANAPPPPHTKAVWYGRWLPVWVLVMLLAAMPRLVLAEERRFRRGAEQWNGWRRARAALGFGLAHLVVGIPVACALALGVAGGAFQARYLRGYARRQARGDAMHEACAVHLAYNTLLLTCLLVPAVVLALHG